MFCTFFVDTHPETSNTFRGNNESLRQDEPEKKLKTRATEQRRWLSFDSPSHRLEPRHPQRSLALLQSSRSDCLWCLVWLYIKTSSPVVPFLLFPIGYLSHKLNSLLWFCSRFPAPPLHCEPAPSGSSPLVLPRLCPCPPLQRAPPLSPRSSTAGSSCVVPVWVWSRVWHPLLDPASRVWRRIVATVSRVWRPIVQRQCISAIHKNVRKTYTELA